MRALGFSRLRRLEAEPRHQRAQVGITPADLTDRRCDQAVLGFDRPQSATDRARGFDDLDLVTGPSQASATDQSRQSAPDDDDRGHLEVPRAGPNGGARRTGGTRKYPNAQSGQQVFVDDDEGGCGLIHGRLREQRMKQI